VAANPKSITKFRALSHLDSWSADPATRDAVYGAALARLNDDSFDVLGRTVAGVEEIAEGPANAAPPPLAHLREHWLSGAYFPDIDEATIRKGIRDGFRDAITDARRADLPLTTVWVRSGNDARSTDFRVDHVVGPTAVTIAIITPAPKT